MTKNQSNIRAYSEKPKQNAMFHKNLKILRKHHQQSQQAVSDALGIKRSTYSGYESGKVEPDIPMLIRLADYFSISLDNLLRENLAAKGETFLSHQDPSIRNENFRVLAITTDKDGKENIEMIREGAQAGYMSGYADPDFLEEMPTLNMPNLGPGTHRAFEVKGDSMWPVQSGDVVVGSYVEHSRDIQHNNRYILLTKTDGIVFKRVLLDDEKPDQLTLLSDNPEYAPYQVNLKAILEAWHYELSIRRDKR